MKYVIFCMGTMFLASTTLAAGELQLADNTPNAPRFLPLPTARDAASQTRAKVPLRSDRAAVEGGFMRIDRARSVAVKSQRAITARGAVGTRETVASAAPLIIRGTGTASVPGGSITPVTMPSSEDPVLDLFNTPAEVPVASFRDAMRNAGNIPMAGASAGKQRWPLPAMVKQEISSGYGMRKDPFHGQPAFHGGVDIAADVGTPVLATADAVVSKVGQDAHYGKFIQLTQPGGIELHYGHLSGQSVREGDRVRAGQPIGTVGSTGRSTGPHLDYRVSLRGTKIDPMSVLTPPAAVTADARSATARAPERGIIRTAAVSRPLRPSSLRSEMQVKVVAVD